jgi:ribonuclease P/MRP protein subunit POP5
MPTTKPLPPTLREKNRYLAFEFISEGRREDSKTSSFSRNEVQRAIWSNALKFLGELGVSKTSLWLIEWNESKQKGILKTNRKSVDEVRAAFALIKEINGKRVIPHILGVSGTIKKTREKFF